MIGEGIKMKKGLSVLLIVAALFGFYGGAVNLNDVLACKDYWEKEGEKSTADMNKLEDGLNQLLDNEEAYLDGLDQVKEGEEKGDNVFTLGDNGYLKTWANEWGDTWGFTYDANGYLTKIERTDKGAVKSNCVWTNGDLSKWSRFKDDGSEEWKIQSFLADENVGGIFADACDKADVSRWIFELGLCGKASKHLLDQAAWEGSEAIAVHTYEKDADGFVTKVNKVYDGGDPEIYEYSWEVVK